MVVGREPERFVDAPLASPSGRFALARPSIAPVVRDLPSPSEVRPWGLRKLTVVCGLDDTRPTDRYCHREQVMVTASGRPVVELLGNDPGSDHGPTSGGEPVNGGVADDRPARP